MKPLSKFLADHRVTPEGLCSCGWNVANYDLKRSDTGITWAGLGDVTPTEAWLHHVTQASYKVYHAIRQKQFVEVVGPDENPVGFVLDSGLLHNHTAGWSLDHERTNRKDYGYQYAGYRRPKRAADDISRSITCEEAQCRNPLCSGGHMTFTVSFPKVCAKCKKPVTDGGQALYMSAPAGTPMETGTPMAMTALYHNKCVPSEKALQRTAARYWPKQPRRRTASNEVKAK